LLLCAAIGGRSRNWAMTVSWRYQAIVHGVSERVLLPYFCPCPQARRSVVQILPSEASERRSKKGPRLVVPRLRLWPFLLLPPDRRARAAD
jgi:hypothetical protein